VEGGEGRGKAYLVNYSIPGETRIINDNMDFTIAKLGSFFDEGFEVGVI
jgi:hypothetical protein